MPSFRWKTADRVPHLEAMAQHVAQKLVDETPPTVRKHLRGIPVEVLNAVEYAHLIGKVTVTKGDGKVSTTSVSYRVLWEAMVRTGLDVVDEALPDHDRVQELAELDDPIAFYRSAARRRYDWGRHPAYCRTTADHVVSIPLELAARTADRAKSAHITDTALLVGCCVGGMAYSDEWMPKWSTTAVHAINVWSAAMSLPDRPDPALVE